MDARTTTETLRQHGRFVHELARALLRDPAAAEDVAQETWVQWWRRAEAPTNPRGWLARVVRSLASNQRRAGERRARREAEGARPEGGRAPDEDAAEAELLHRVVDAVYGLEEPYRETILARYFRGEDARALSDASSTPLATVRSRERRALEMLRAKLDREPGGRAAWAVALARLVPLEPTAAAGALLVPWVAAAFLVAAGALGWGWLRQAELPAEQTVAPLETSSLRDDASEARLEAAEAPSARAELMPSRARSSSSNGDSSEVNHSASALAGTTRDTEGRILTGVRLGFLSSGRFVGATSDAEGRFEVQKPEPLDQVTAELPGYLFLDVAYPDPDPTRPSEGMRVTLAAVGTVVVYVHDWNGEALEGVLVKIFPRPEELAESASSERFPGEEAVNFVTDETGRAFLTDVRCGVRLTLCLDIRRGAPIDQVTIHRQRDGRLVLDGGAGMPIVLVPNQVLELSVEWPLPQTLEGVVIDTLGEPVTDALVELIDDGYEQGEPEHRLHGKTTVEGRFQLAFRRAALRGPLRVQATRLGPVRQIRSPDTLVSVIVADSRTELPLTPEDLDTREPITLTLAPTGLLTLSGTLLDSRGDSAFEREQRLLLLRDGVPLPEQVAARVSTGAFLFYDLAPGLYELLVASVPAEDSPGEPAFARFSELAAGTGGAVLELPASAQINLRVRGEALRVVSLARLVPARPQDFPRVLAQREQTLRSPAFWLPGSRGPRSEVPEGTWILVEKKVRSAPEVDLALGEPGWYRIGVASAAPLASVASELLWFEAGEYVLDVQPPPATGILRGRLVADGTREFYGLVLADDHGQPFPIAAPTSGERLDVYSLKASGEFLLRELPVGRYRLRFGPTDELAAGRWAREVALEIQPGENALEVRL